MPDNSDPRRVFSPGLFNGTTALVTGGGRGIGRAIALGFARSAATSSSPATSPTNSKAVGAGDRGARRRHASRSTSTSATSARSTGSATQSLERFGAVDFVINNAGGQFQANPFDISDNGWRSVVDLNLNGTWNMCSRFMPHLMERQRGSIVNIVHIYCFERGAPMFAHSGAARAGVVNLTRSLAPYLEARNVTINALAPGVTVSPAAAANYGFTEEEWRAQPSRSRYADPEDMAAIILFLCSPAARMINGSVIVADAAATQTNWPLLDDLLDEVRDRTAPTSP